MESSESQGSNYQLIVELFDSWTWNMVRRNLEKGASLEWRHPADGSSPFHHAVLFNNPDVAEKILKRRQDAGLGNTPLLNSELCQGNQPLHLACRWSNLSLLDMILRWDGDITIPDKDGELPLHLACKHQRSSVVDRLMDQPGFEVDILNSKLETALHKACFAGDVDIVRRLLEKNADVNRKHVASTRPLLIAVTHQHWEVVNLLLERPDFDIHVKDVTGSTALHHTCRLREEDKMPALADVTQAPQASTASPDTSEQEPNFCDLDCLPVIKSLLQRGVEVNVVARDGTTPLYFACRNGDREVVQLLLQHGAKIRMENATDCMEYAEHNGPEYVVKMLKEHTEATD